MRAALLELLPDEKARVPAARDGRVVTAHLVLAGDGRLAELALALGGPVRRTSLKLRRRERYAHPRDEVLAVTLERVRKKEVLPRRRDAGHADLHLLALLRLVVARAHLGSLRLQLRVQVP